MIRRWFLFGTCLSAACAGQHANELGVWHDKAPLAPPIHFAEAIPPRTLAVLVLDGHSSAPVANSMVTVASAQLVGVTDSTGVLRLHLPHDGQFALRIRGVGYEMWQGNVSVSDGAGAALVAQLHRSYAPLEPVIAGTAPPRHQ
jgi:hypothetical protein